jgi:hypothetical protein
VSPLLRLDWVPPFSHPPGFANDNKLPSILSWHSNNYHIDGLTKLGAVVAVSYPIPLNVEIDPAMGRRCGIDFTQQTIESLKKYRVTEALHNAAFSCGAR